MSQTAINLYKVYIYEWFIHLNKNYNEKKVNYRNFISYA